MSIDMAFVYSYETPFQLKRGFPGKWYLSSTSPFLRD